MRSALLLLTILLFLGACSTSNDVISKGPIQKRKYRPGWYVDIGFNERDGRDRSNNTHVARNAHARNEVIEAPDPTSWNGSATASLDTTRIGPWVVDTRAPLAFSPSRTKVVHGQPPLDARWHIQTPTKTAVPAEPPTLNDRAERPMNRTALWGFIIAYAGLIGFFFFPELSYLIFAGFVLGIIGLLQVLHRKERGLGFAIAAILGPLAFILLAIYVLSGLGNE